MGNEKTIRIWVDGGSSGNPGRGAIAFIVEWDNQRILFSVTLEEKVTNNEAEYKALLEALICIFGFPFIAFIEHNQYHLVVYSDSQLIVNQVNDLWSVKKKKFNEWLEELRSFLSRFKSWEIKWIPREKNKICDNLVKLVLCRKL
jgi:ribonuclease HI